MKATSCTTTSASAMLLALVYFLNGAIVSVNAQQTQPFDNCDNTTYYASLGDDTSTWTLEALTELLSSTHRNVLPIQKPGFDDVYTALIDLYPGDTPNSTVWLPYRNISYAASPYANSQSWSRGNIWPEERRQDFPEESDSDIHSNIPADTTVFASKGVLFFGLCGTVEDAELCRSLPEAVDTKTDDKVWEPIEDARGAQARMAFYMAARYGSEGAMLSDCPPFGANTYGYLSPFLEWHKANPPTPEEIARNERMCERWQGNRNPFIDHPELVEQFFGEPDTIREGYKAYSECFEGDLIATQAPTAAPNACDDVVPGDIQLILANSEAPDQMAFFTLDNIPSAVETIYVTDRPWNGTHLLENGEGVMEFEMPAETVRPSDSVRCNGFCPGLLYAFGFDNNLVNWTEGEDGGTFDLGIGGDTILTYCIDSDGEPHFIQGFSFAEGGWAEPGLADEEYGTEKSALPQDLNKTGTHVAVPFFQNNIYNGTANAQKAELLEHYANPDNYEGSNEIKYDISALHNETSSAGPVSMPTTTTLMIVATVVALVVVAPLGVIDWL